MIAFILTAGLGTRLKPLTDHCPKALVPYQGKPLLAHLLERMQAFGIRHFVLNLHHFADQLQAYAADYAKEHGLQIDFSDERALLLDTGGALTHALPLFDRDSSLFLRNFSTPEFLSSTVHPRDKSIFSGILPGFIFSSFPSADKASKEPSAQARKNNFPPLRSTANSLSGNPLSESGGRWSWALSWTGRGRSSTGVWR